ncbi:NAD(+) synthase [Mycoplasma nasistruthionis]|uniref:NH(3)-dependent NAD(+) synthetase n=1 Tax=Mycoplasma nasistruthionis TaxID=353852 RepID=A0A4Y6I734_9MOLU|nr:NAD(+) synthase [Mycoplasma nasistruthionis]QDF65057.1 NAD(+) synthase [Mycoplasma nasistruthionis]
MAKFTTYNGLNPIYDEIKAKQYLKTIQEFLKNHAKQANVSGFIVGISGGIDSALVYAIAKSVFPQSTYGFVMPIIKMSDSDLNHINQLEKQFDDKFTFINLTETFYAITQANKSTHPLSIANIKPRLRMTTLYYQAQAKNALVLGTDNYDETFIGYFTKFGDGGADLLPISQLTKGEVKFLAKLMNVPNSIINKDPSAGLWDGQTDEKELGFSYAQLDYYLDHLDNYDLVKQNLPETIINKIEHKHKISQHKRDAIYKPQ